MVDRLVWVCGVLPQQVCELEPTYIITQFAKLYDKQEEYEKVLFEAENREFVPIDFVI